MRKYSVAHPPKSWLVCENNFETIMMNFEIHKVKYLFNVKDWILFSPNVLKPQVSVNVAFLRNKIFANDQVDMISLGWVLIQ